MNDVMIMVQAYGVLCFVAAMSAGMLIVGITSWSAVKRRTRR